MGVRCVYALVAVGPAASGAPGCPLSPPRPALLSPRRLQLDVRPSSLELSTRLGNVSAQYAALPAASPYRTIAALAPGAEGSLVELRFR